MFILALGCVSGLGAAAVLRGNGVSARKLYSTPPAFSASAPEPSPSPAKSPLIDVDPGLLKENQKVDVYYVSELLDRFRDATRLKRKLSDHRHAIELQRLQTAIALAPTADDRWALQQAAEGNEELHLESKNAFKEMENFANTIKQMMGSKGTTKLCSDLTCGEHGYCEETEKEGAVCKCEEGYEGDGFICHVPSVTIAHAFIDGHVQAFDIDLGVYNGTRNLACVYRDQNQDNSGFLSLGISSPVTVKWKPVVPFTGPEQKAFATVVTGLPSGRLGIAYRDSEKSGKGWLQGAEVNDATGAVKFGERFEFSALQEDLVQILPLPQNHVAVFFADQIIDAEGKVENEFGSVSLFQIQAGGGVHFVGKFRFAEFSVSRIRPTLLSVDEFVIAYRHVQTEPGADKQEGSVIYGAFHDGELVLDPHPLLIEPKDVGILARDVQLVAMNTFAYGYYFAKTDEVRVAIVEVNPDTHRMKMLRTHTVSKGETPFLNGVSLAFAPKEPRSYFYFKSGIKSVSSSCALMDSKKDDCESSSWTSFDVQQVAAKSIGESRVIMTFTDHQHIPHFLIIALA